MLRRSRAATQDEMLTFWPDELCDSLRDSLRDSLLGLRDSLLGLRDRLPACGLWLGYNIIMYIIVIITKKQVGSTLPKKLRGGLKSCTKCSQGSKL